VHSLVLVVLVEVLFFTGLTDFFKVVHLSVQVEVRKVVFVEYAHFKLALVLVYFLRDEHIHESVFDAVF